MSSRGRRLWPLPLLAFVACVTPSLALAQQLTLSWVDNSGGQAGFIVQRATGSTGTYAQIAQVPAGVVTYTDSAVVLGTTYCYKVAAVNTAGMSAFSNSACSAPGGGFTLTVTKAGNGSGTVTDSSGGLNCGSVCAYTYPAGKPVTLTATAASGSTFSGWSGGACSGTGPCSLVGNVPMTVTATFAVGTAATISSITPNQGTAGVAVPVTINGSGFATGAAVSVGAGVTSSNVAVVSSTQVTATLTIASGASAGSRDVTVTNPGGAAATLTGGFSVVSATPPALTLSYNGLLRDRVGQGDTAAGPDGALDGTFTVTLSASGGRTITALRLDSSAPGTWDTIGGNQYWVLGVAATLDGPLLNAPGSMAVNFPVANGGSFVLFAADYLNGEFLPGRTLTLTATFSDGSTATATITLP
ncbi:MAG TPA: IPT/TIG domain-containing protein [Candidatus Bathyarchaeia archaeon]|nr:IPT/TIG domain-containing protein [Candidatus Bathyarchaeia archaeon]